MVDTLLCSPKLSNEKSSKTLFGDAKRPHHARLPSLRHIDEKNSNASEKRRGRRECAKFEGCDLLRLADLVLHNVVDPHKRESRIALVVSSNAPWNLIQNLHKKIRRRALILRFPAPYKVRLDVLKECLVPLYHNLADWQIEEVARRLEGSSTEDINEVVRMATSAVLLRFQTSTSFLLNPQTNNYVPCASSDKGAETLVLSEIPLSKIRFGPVKMNDFDHAIMDLKNKSVNFVRLPDVEQRLREWASTSFF